MPCPKNEKHVDPKTGAARAGSQLQIQNWVNYNQQELNDLLLAALSSLPAGVRLRWVSPLKEDYFNEYRDREFLEKLGLQNFSAQLEKFWPGRGPCWDALAMLEGVEPKGVILVEGKSHPTELSSQCKAGPDSRRKILQALNATAKHFGVPRTPAWMEEYYQSANRLAHLYFLREIAKVPAWLVNIYFLGDKSVGHFDHIPDSQENWVESIQLSKQHLGIENKRIPFSADLYLSTLLQAALGSKHS